MPLKKDSISYFVGTILAVLKMSSCHKLFRNKRLFAKKRNQPDQILPTSINYFSLSLLDGLQGLMVAIAFCYRNGEVILT